VPLLPGAEPYASGGGPVGALLCHGFTGCPQSLRPWAEHLAQGGLTVRLPRLPGHGTRWQDMNVTRWPDWYAEVERALADLRDRCEAVFVMGLSMGGTLALRLAEQRGGDIAGLVLVNASLLDPRRAFKLLPVLELVLPSTKGIARDIKNPAATEVAYDRTPLRALASLVELWALTRNDLAKVTQPVLVFRSLEDHVVAPDSGRLLLAKISSTDVEEITLADSYHVATLDNDAPRIFDGSLQFVRRLTPADAQR
jgi:carboxylesterase